MDNTLIGMEFVEEIKEDLLEHSLRNNIEHYLDDKNIPYAHDDVENIWWVSRAE
jgi:hypothetical protein